ncbi:hypothetical protein [Paracoccus aminophilus]|uniref:Uncharacterized protein n=1 Tax=Paracoccus aminophilus JCM 7686 TaxID=1367847 RepID=S5XTX7_PARAH|nr:hypothetical protein [Paracoccus aminophilus]AGT08627.1 hypothetical protein JCM7686_1526 [Paracoccus aminophilus JCM 7686]
MCIRLLARPDPPQDREQAATSPGHTTTRLIVELRVISAANCISSSSRLSRSGATPREMRTDLAYPGAIAKADDDTIETPPFPAYSAKTWAFQ